MSPKNILLPFCCVFLPAVKKNFTVFRRYALYFILLGFGPTEVSLTKLHAHSKTALPSQEDYNA